MTEAAFSPPHRVPTSPECRYPSPRHARRPCAGRSYVTALRSLSFIPPRPRRCRQLAIKSRTA
ncbi:hypothetical protein FA09DRAFT_362566, partial [Tilletiopsis washingtonensis]